MDKERFLDEIGINTVEELELIFRTQQELYTDEELSIIQKRIEELHVLQEERNREKVRSLLPKEIVCPKCSGPNPFENDICQFCGYTLEKGKYYTLEYYEKQEQEENDTDEAEESYLFQYIISFLIPLAAFIMGGIMMTDEGDKADAGKRCVLLGIISVVISAVIMAVKFSG